MEIELHLFMNNSSQMETTKEGAFVDCVTLEKEQMVMINLRNSQGIG